MPKTSDNVTLEMYRAAVGIFNEASGEGGISKEDEEFDRILRIMFSLLPIVHDELRGGPSNDIGRAEGYAVYAENMKQHLQRLNATPVIDRLLPLAESAMSAGLDAIGILQGADVVPAPDGEVGSETRSLHDVLVDLRGHILGSNELSDDQKKDALGYVESLVAISNMANPDKKAFEGIVSRLSEYGTSIGNVVIIEAAKELLKWGFKNLLG